MNTPSWSMPTRTAAVDFWWRSSLFKLRRGWQNFCTPALRRWTTGESLAQAPIIGQLRVPLWTDGRDDEFALVAGKVQNLRIAARAFDGIEVPAGQCLSFWKQLGRPTRWRGYVPGREVRAGCVIPTIAGGICQISNALATCAARAGFELVERHTHSARVEQIQERDGHVDATVYWNYIDLRIRATVNWRLEIALTASEMVLAIRAQTNTSSKPPVGTVIPLRLVEPSGQHKPVARGCLTCEEWSCYLHRPQDRGRQAREAWLLDIWTPEFDHWLRAQESRSTNTPDRFLPILPEWMPGRHGNAQRWLSLPADANSQVVTFPVTCLRRMCRQRLVAYGSRVRQAGIVMGQRWLARAYASRLRPEHTHLVIDQGLLAPL